MKKLAFVALGALVIGLAACKKPTTTAPPTGTPNPKTELVLVVSDSTGTKPVEGAYVELYKTQADFSARKESARIQGIHYTGVDGRCKIGSLEGITYWFYIYNGAQTNMADVTSKALLKDQTNTVVVKIK